MHTVIICFLDVPEIRIPCFTVRICNFVCSVLLASQTIPISHSTCNDDRNINSIKQSVADCITYKFRVYRIRVEPKYRHRTAPTEKKHTHTRGLRVVYATCWTLWPNAHTTPIKPVIYLFDVYSAAQGCAISPADGVDRRREQHVLMEVAVVLAIVVRFVVCGPWCLWFRCARCWHIMPCSSARSFYIIRVWYVLDRFGANAEFIGVANIRPAGPSINSAQSERLRVNMPPPSKRDYTRAYVCMSVKEACNAGPNLLLLLSSVIRPK